LHQFTNPLSAHPGASLANVQIVFPLWQLCSDLETIRFTFSFSFLPFVAFYFSSFLRVDIFHVFLDDLTVQQIIVNSSHFDNSFEN
jgi:hypothetical protein